MFDVSILPKLKGSQLAIIIAMMLNGNRTVSQSELATITNRNEKTIRKDLQVLKDLRIITSPRFNRYQLSGDNIQLPLFWDEQMQTLSGNPVKKTEAVKNTGSDSEMSDLYQNINPVKFTGNPVKFTENPVKNTGFESAPLINLNINNQEVSKKVSKETYLLTYTYTDNNIEVNSLTPAVNFTGNPVKNTGFENAWKAAMVQMKGSMDQQTFGTMLEKAMLLDCVDGHFTVGVQNSFVREWAEQRITDTVERILSGMLNEKATVSFVVHEGCRQRLVKKVAWQDYPKETQAKEETEPCKDYGAPSLELLPVPDDPGKAALTEICNAYLLEPTGIEYTNDQLIELINMQPHPDVLRFALPTMSNFEAVKFWCGKKHIEDARRVLLKKYGIVNGMAAEIVHNDNATLEMIMSVCKELCPKDKGAVGDRIRKLTSDGKIPEF